MWNWCLIIQQVFSDLTICIAIKSDECDQNKKINFWITAAYIPRKENLDAERYSSICNSWKSATKSNVLQKYRNCNSPNSAYSTMVNFTRNQIHPFGRLQKKPIDMSNIRGKFLEDKFSALSLETEDEELQGGMAHISSNGNCFVIKKIIRFQTLTEAIEFLNF